MLRIRYFLLSLVSLASVVSCIENDLPYPKIEARIEAMDVDGAESVVIDQNKRTVSIVLSEETDIRQVNVRSISFNDETVTASWDITGIHDFSTKVKVTLRTYEDFVWEIVTSQPISREFSVSGQMGESFIDAVNRRVIARVSPDVGLASVKVLSMKLGPKEITTYSPSAEELTDFSEAVTVNVLYREHSEAWTIFIEKMETTVRFDAVDAWTGVAWLRASGQEGRNNGFRYRKAGETEWKEAEDLSSESGMFSAALRNLLPETDYECVAYSGNDETEVRTFRTEEDVQVPNGGFETYSHAESGKYFSFFDPQSPDPALQTKWWGSGNKGSTTVGSSFAITMPDQSDCMEGSSSLLMASAYVVIKFAAGNVFSGEFGKTVGTSGGIVRMGRPFTTRPQKITLWVKYRGGTITDKTFGGKPDGDPVKAGDKDRGSVWVALGTWDYKKYGGTPDCPVEINTTDKSTFFDPEGPDVIAYGRFIADEDMEWTRIEIPLDYVSTSRKPTHIIISAAASMLGDYFTGSADSRMWIDDIRLEY